MPPELDHYQRRFERRWGHLTRPHVRALAWLLDAPDLLDPASPHWNGQIASLGPVTSDVAAWLENRDAPLPSGAGPVLPALESS